MLPAPASGVRLADAIQVYLGTIGMANTRETYEAALDRLAADFGVDTTWRWPTGNQTV
jgi:integrase/recombinase XerC/integrase/recombinase XerD